MALNTIAARLHAQIAAVCPIDGIAMGRFEDKSTWRIAFGSGATVQQQGMAQVILANFDPNAPVADDIKAEAQRRIVMLTGKDTLQDCIIKQLNALMRAGELTDKRVNGEVLVPEEETEASSLRVFAKQIEAIRAASNVLENTNPIPGTYQDNKNWPPV